MKFMEVGGKRAMVRVTCPGIRSGERMSSNLEVQSLRRCLGAHDDNVLVGGRCYSRSHERMPKRYSLTFVQGWMWAHKHETVSSYSSRRRDHGPEGDGDWQSQRQLQDGCSDGFEITLFRQGGRYRYNDVRQEGKTASPCRGRPSHRSIANMVSWRAKGPSSARNIDEAV